MNTRFVLGGLIGLSLVFAFAAIARFTFLGGSLFDPRVAPGIGPFALGDLLAVAAFVVGCLLSRAKINPQA